MNNVQSTISPQDKQSLKQKMSEYTFAIVYCEMACEWGPIHDEIQF